MNDISTIVGAGLAGLIAAHAFPRAQILEAAPEPREGHKALLRFRTPDVGRLVGVDFRPVTVRKSIWVNGRHTGPTVDLANQYSKKCLGGLVGDRSIWNLEPVTRYIAPLDFYALLVERLYGRIVWDAPLYFRHACPESPVISTAPLDKVCADLGLARDLEFKRKAIHVRRFVIPNCDVFQTVYFPSPDVNTYRASITGDVLIVESTDVISETDLCEVEKAFGMVFQGVDELDAIKQRYGKIHPVDEARRKRLMAHLTSEYGIYSIGRFATWRNILLADLVNDVAVVKRLLKADEHDRRIMAL